ncbi:hypothetical protein IMCC9480_3654 [Oxalobacteraceae bacterium IMCC9480]|nr:hypothetical protein IMCC9480_3654 [Oxalobacteraceae bacterium IMCC9480]
MQRLQLEIATAFRPHADAQGKLDGSFMAEIQGLEHPGSPATSNLPVTLHRALNLPLLVVEHDGQSAQLRVAAPHGSDIAQHVEQLTQQAGDPQESIDTLLSAFSHRPILWLDKDHYSLHFPTGNSSQ